MDKLTEKRVKNHQYFGEIAVIDFLNKNNVDFKIEDGYRKTREISILNKSKGNYYWFIKISKGGVIEFVNRDNEVYKLLIEEYTCNLTTEIIKEYEKIKKIMVKNYSKIERGLNLNMKDYFIIYSKQEKRLIVYPNIIYTRAAAVGNIFGEIKRMHEPGYFIQLLHDEAYYLMSNILEKPLNEYTDDELIVMDMIDI